MAATPRVSASPAFQRKSQNTSEKACSRTSFCPICDVQDICMFRQSARLRQGMVRIISPRATQHLKREARIMATSEGASRQHQIDLFTGWPNPGLLPPESIKNAANDMLSDASTVPSILRYGEDEGYIELRREIAKWLSTFYRPTQDIGYKRICVTGGASQNLACVLQTFTDPVYTRNVCK